jgi:hypothetical protein
MMAAAPVSDAQRLREAAETFGFTMAAGRDGTVEFRRGQEVVRCQFVGESFVSARVWHNGLRAGSQTRSLWTAVGWMDPFSGGRVVDHG